MKNTIWNNSITGRKTIWKIYVLWIGVIYSLLLVNLFIYNIVITNGYLCDVRYDFRIKTMFGSSLPPLVCRRTHVLFTLFVFAYSGVKHILWCAFVLFFFVLCTSCCQFLWIVHFWLPIRYSLTFICKNIFSIFLIKAENTCRTISFH